MNYLVIDVGTSGCRATVVSGKGQVLSQSRGPVSIDQSRPALAGGGANVESWNRIRADASGLEVRKLAITEATSPGTALFCMAALDKTRSLKEIAAEWVKVDGRFGPNKNHTKIYRELGRLFEAQVQSNADVDRGLNRLRRKNKAHPV